jgi:hypothetical protein
MQRKLRLYNWRQYAKHRLWLRFTWHSCYLLDTASIGDIMIPARGIEKKGGAFQALREA